MSDATGARMEELVIRRIIDAPVDLVWEAWTNPDHVMRWWGPKYYTSPSCTIDLRVGGRYVFCMQAPAEMGGTVSYTAGVYKRIVHNKVLEFTQAISDKDGNPIDPTTIGLPADFPEELNAVVTFEAKGELTRLSIEVHGWTASQMFVFAYAGWHQQTDKFEEILTQLSRSAGT